MKSSLSIRKTGRNGAIFVKGGLFSRELLVTHYITMSCFTILTHFVTYMVWLRTSNVATSWFGFCKDCGGVGENRQLKWNLCKSILLLHSSVFHFFVVTLSLLLYSFQSLNWLYLIFNNFLLFLNLNQPGICLTQVFLLVTFLVSDLLDLLLHGLN